MPLNDIALTLEKGIGPKTAAYLISVYGSAQAVFEASMQDLVENAQLNVNIAKSIIRKNNHRAAESEVKRCREKGIIPIPATATEYPEMLKDCGDYPHVIYYKGNPQALKNDMLSIVGTRRITSYGQAMCNSMIAELAQCRRDITIVSGIAYGVDATAHRAAIDNGIPTIAVSPVALPKITPAQHDILAEKIIDTGGGILSEYNSLNKDKGVNFVARNRIIAGLGQGTLIVETPLKGGSMITARLADGYNRCVMAIPGRLTDERSAGTNYLIRRNTAIMVTSGTEIAEELGWQMNNEKGASWKEPDLSQVAVKLLNMIREAVELSIDDLYAGSGLDISDIAMGLLELEMERKIRMLPGKRYQAV